MNLVLLAGGIALVATILTGPFFIPTLRWLKFGQHVRSDGPRSHLKKAGTPTMGGIMFLFGITAAILAVIALYRGTPNLSGLKEGLVVLLVMLGYGAVGFIDDFLKIALRRPLGLKARQKLLGQVVVAVILAVVTVFFLGRGTDLVIPFSGFLQPGGISIDLGWWFFLGFTVLVLLGSANAVNLTDGLDGLAAGATAITAFAFALIAIIVDKTWVAVVLGAMAGGCLGFLYYNRYPARVFMGDTGSLALGGGLAAAAVLTRSELFLIFIGGIYVMETLSVMVQVFSFQVFGRRVLRMAPLHHHFELMGWTETRVVTTFWLIGLLTAIIGLLGLYRLG
ncbi:MAG: phospho-N-acetylmuramoyl-pentapeptide-transferase [Bacillota bacterium]|uniref:phospho-N-acetylmuramoyl-pentapeptide- transferase n=1 Tax=Desulforudis sp. DRI-14 TaxID=3459793 RepID=UPI003498C119